MKVLTGILLDVSGSMRRSVGGRINQKGGSWARSIFRVVDQLLKSEITNDSRVFALGYGAYSQPDVFDLLNTVEKASGYSGAEHEGTKLGNLNEILDILERNGASHVRKWACMDVLESSVSEQEAKLFLTMLLNNRSNFTTEFVLNCLPNECRSRISSLKAAVAKNRHLAKDIPICGQVVHDRIETATQACIREAIDKGMTLIWESLANSLSTDAIISVQRASEILHGCIDEESLNEHQVDKLMEAVDPFIYGRTPMISALKQAKTFMSLSEYKDHHKVLFILSDGEPTDGDTPPDLSHLNVHVVSCYITDSKIADPNRLYSSKCEDWNREEKFMFDLSSSISTQQLPRTIFVRQGWKIDFENNETKLFLQVNHPDLIDEVCAFARDVVCFQDALSDLLSSIDLDLYINKYNNEFGAQDQTGGTCYANASAAVIHLATKRIFKRDGGYPDFGEIRDKLIARYGVDGANTFKVLQEICPGYRLHCQEVDIMGALKAVTGKRPVISRFRLTDAEWKTFKKFYKMKPAGILSKKDLDITNRTAGDSTSGHAVVLTSFNSKGLTFMNSWGTLFANNGFFSVENAEVLGLTFVDVYWTLNDLRPSEIQSYEREGPSKKLENLKSLKGLKDAKYECPLCHRESLVSKFTGRLVEATCPKCHRVFNTDSHDAHDLVLNMYLTSLCCK